MVEYFHEKFRSITQGKQNTLYATDMKNLLFQILTQLVLVDLGTLVVAYNSQKKPTLVETFNSICFAFQIFVMMVALHNAEWISWTRLTTLSNVANICYVFYRSLDGSHNNTQLNDTARNILVPTAMLVAVVYWIGVCTALPFKREPLWIEIGEHGAFLIIFIVDFIIERNHFPHKLESFTIKPLVTVQACYLLFMALVKWLTDRWIYDLDASVVILLPGAALAVDIATMYTWHLIVKFIDRKRSVVQPVNFGE